MAQLTITLGRTEKAWAEQRAKAEGISISAVVRAAIVSQQALQQAMEVPSNG